MKTRFMFWLLTLVILVLPTVVHADTSRLDNKWAGNPVIASSGATNIESEETEGLLLTVKLDEVALKSSGKLHLDIVCKNLLGCPVQINTTGSALDYYIELIAPNGKKLQEQRNFMFPRTGLGTEILKPGAEKKRSWELNQIFIIKNPGVYTLRAYRNVNRLDKNGSAKLASNLIKFELAKEDLEANAKYWGGLLKVNSMLRYKEEHCNGPEYEEDNTNRPLNNKVTETKQ